ncbi:unnamed protein product, partial [Rotaria magnacalcarata]
MHAPPHAKSTTIEKKSLNHDFAFCRFEYLILLIAEYLSKCLMGHFHV